MFNILNIWEKISKGSDCVPVNYNPLWKLLIDRNMIKSKLRLKANISTATLAKMGKGEYVALEVLERICLNLSCQLSEVVEVTPNIYMKEGKIRSNLTTEKSAADRHNILQ